MFDEIIKNLKANNMRAFAVNTSAEVVELIKTIVPKGAITACGGSVTLSQTGVLELLQHGDYKFYDRFTPGLTRDQIDNIFRMSFFSDYYFSSTNAITEDGVLFNVDGNSNRTAALLYGPKNVIIIAGRNKIVKNLDEASRRVKLTAAPLNSKRLNCKTYCAETGHCVSLDKDACEYSDGCASDSRICCNYVISAKQRVKDRITVILVNEELGY